MLSFSGSMCARTILFSTIAVYCHPQKVGQIIVLRVEDLLLTDSESFGRFGYASDIATTPELVTGKALREEPMIGVKHRFIREGRDLCGFSQPVLDILTF